MNRDDTRECEFCSDWEEYGSDDVCGACNGTKELGIEECFCYARAPNECGCNARWGDWVYFEEDY